MRKDGLGAAHIKLLEQKYCILGPTGQAKLAGLDLLAKLVSKLVSKLVFGAIYGPVHVHVLSVVDHGGILIGVPRVCSMVLWQAFDRVLDQDVAVGIVVVVVLVWVQGGGWRGREQGVVDGRSRSWGLGRPWVNVTARGHFWGVPLNRLWPGGQCRDLESLLPSLLRLPRADVIPHVAQEGHGCETKDRWGLLC